MSYRTPHEELQAAMRGEPAPKRDWRGLLPAVAWIIWAAFGLFFWS